MIKERPILFSAPMVRALLDGSKTQTRRIVKPQPRMYEPGMDTGLSDYTCDMLVSPYGRFGDRLWVRETWYCDDYRVQSGPYLEVDGARELLTYRADDERPYEADQPIWKPSIHMPRWASRILLEIVSVRVERLNECSEADADAEGCERLDNERVVADRALCVRCGGTRLHRALGTNGGVIEDVDCAECDTYTKRYKHLWESINGAGSWDTNPWCWVIEFSRVLT